MSPTGTDGAVASRRPETIGIGTLPIGRRPDISLPMSDAGEMTVQVELLQ